MIVFRLLSIVDGVILNVVEQYVSNLLSSYLSYLIYLIYLFIFLIDSSPYNTINILIQTMNRWTNAMLVYGYLLANALAE